GRQQEPGGGGGVPGRVCHGRSVDQQGVLQQAAVAIWSVLQLLEEVRKQAHVVPVDLREIEDAVLAIVVVRGDVETGRHAGPGEHTVGDVAAQLEREDAGDVGGEGDRLQIEHQPDVLFVRIRHADRSHGQLARFAAG